MNVIVIGKCSDQVNLSGYFHRKPHLSKHGSLEDIERIAHETANFLRKYSLNFGDYKITNGTKFNSFYQKLNARELGRFNFSLLGHLLQGEKN